jgi:hypothetical protein
MSVCLASPQDFTFAAWIYGPHPSSIPSLSLPLSLSLSLSLSRATERADARRREDRRPKARPRIGMSATASPLSSSSLECPRKQGVVVHFPVCNAELTNNNCGVPFAS